MTRYPLLRTPAFVKVVKRILKRRPDLLEEISETLQQLELDPYHPSLRTHKLTGELSGSYACSAGYDLRILFKFVREGGKPAILLETLGTHDEVY